MRTKKRPEACARKGEIDVRNSTALTRPGTEAITWLKAMPAEEFEGEHTAFAGRLKL